ncbi:5'-nucleotidase C-terminal domain-containing protein [Neobacillus sp. YIM B06451]|uniref:5'-nucleotidase C-terminal domain-containing protein n=1 Tax=Neobacillus sp. YIM B06451 TaxID=3070994 RepID=UPI0029300F2D|nr:5'-nucleotidase C-terminal domain-containing protein [Neobacillus sp. YIM B06451]
MKALKRQLLILTTILTMLAGTVFPYAGKAGAEENFITVAQAIANNTGTATVKGYIVAYTVGTRNYDFEAPFGGNTNIAIADSATERDPAKILPVQLPSGDFRTKFNLQSNPGNQGKQILVTGSLEAYFTVPGLKSPTAMSFVGETPKDPEPSPEGLKIHQIQGSSHESPYKDQTVKGVRGIVTYVEDASNFYMQSATPDTDPNTSEGILVYKPTHNVKVGDLVSVDGLVKEWVLDGYSDKLQTDLAMTELNATGTGNSVSVISRNNPLPEALVIGKDFFPPTQVIDNDRFGTFDPNEDGIDFYESIEGMRVTIENPIATAPQKYGEIPVIARKVDGKPYTIAGGTILTKDNANPERMHILMGDRNYVNKTGDRLNGTVTGVVSYGFQNYKILTDRASLPELVEGPAVRETTTIKKEADKLTVATYNMENYRASETVKTQKIAESIVYNLNSPDIIGLVEVQDNNGPTNDGTTDASQNYQALINAIKGAGGPTYAWTDIAPENLKDGGEPGGNIRVGYLYNSERVQLAAGAPKGTATQAVNYENGSLTLNPGRIDPTHTAFNSSRKPLAAEFVFNGEKVIVIANHFNSKGGDQPIFGKNQPPVLGSEAQRLEIARIVNNFVSDVQTKNPDANMVVLGDLNDFEFSKPLEVLKGDDLTNLIETVPLPERYTYNYQGNAQVLDHMLVSNRLAQSSELDIVHLNADFSAAQGRVSDHDPLVAKIDLTPEPAGPKPLDLTIMHVNDSHAHVEQYPKLVTAVNEVRSQAKNNLLLDAGDVFSGTLYFKQYQGLADLEFMNLLRYDAMTFGNHEFDKTSETLANFISKANFPIVSANVDVSKDATLGKLFENNIATQPAGGKIYPAIIKEIDGEKVGIFGLTTTDTTFLANPADEIVFNNAIDKAKATVAALKEQGVNKIIALSHLGYVPDQDLAAKVDGIDVIVGGHSHTKLDKPVLVAKAEPTLIVQANEYLNYLGKLEVSFDENGVIKSHNGVLLELKGYAADEAASARVAELKAPLDELRKQVVGHTTVPLNGVRDDVRSKETNLGNMIADAMVAKANESLPTTIGIQNGGGIRASIDVGEITLGEILEVMPFENQLVALDLTGAEIWAALENGVSQVETKQGKFPQVSGLRFQYDPAKPAMQRVWKVEVKNGDKYEAIDLNKTYRVATNAFVADGGDGYTSFKKAKDEGRIHELFVVDFEVLASYIEKNSPLSPGVEGRILAGQEPPKIVTGWVEKDGQWFYYDAEGKKVTGWLEVEGKKYYLDPAADGARATGWKTIDGSIYYFNEEGVMQVGPVTIDGKTYLFNEEGVQQTDKWSQYDGWWYHLDKDGVVKKKQKNAPPGQIGNTPGQGGSQPPGQSGETPGKGKKSA